MESVYSPEMSVSTCQTTRCHNLQDHNISPYWWGKFSLETSRTIIILWDLKWLPPKREQVTIPLHRLAHWRHEYSVQHSESQVSTCFYKPFLLHFDSWRLFFLLFRWQYLKTEVASFLSLLDNPTFCLQTFCYHVIHLFLKRRAM